MIIIQTAVTQWLYDHSLTGIAVGMVAVLITVTLYMLTHKARSRRVRVITIILLCVVAIAGATGFFLMGADTFISAVCGVVGVASCLVAGLMLLSKEKCR